MAYFSIIIPHFSGIGILSDCLESLFRASGQFEVILVDNGSTDDSVAVVRSKFPRVFIHEPGENLGYAGGCTAGAAFAKGEWLVFLNNDTVVHPEWLVHLETAMTAHPDATCFQPKILSLQSHRAGSAVFDYAGAAGGRLDWLGYPFAFGRVMDAIEADKGQYDDPRPLFWSSGTAMVIRRKEAIGLQFFVPAFFAHMEEIDLCWRLLASGGQVKSVPSSVVWHLGGQTLALGHPRKMYLNHRNNWLMVVKNVPLTYLILISPFRILLDLMAGFSYSRKQGWEGFKIILRAWKWLWMNRHLLSDLRNQNRETIKWSGFRRVLAQMEPVPVVVRRVLRAGKVF